MTGDCKIAENHTPENLGSIPNEKGLQHAGPFLSQSKPSPRLPVGWCNSIYVIALYISQTHRSDILCATSTKAPARRTGRRWHGAFGLIPCPNSLDAHMLCTSGLITFATRDARCNPQRMDVVRLPRRSSLHHHGSKHIRLRPEPNHSKICSRPKSCIVLEQCVPSSVSYVLSANSRN